MELLLLAKRPEILATLITVIGGAVFGRLFQPKARVIWGGSHQFAFNIPQSAGGQHFFFTRTIFLRNMGRAPAKNVEVHFTAKPEHFQLWPTFIYSAQENPENQYIVTIESLGPRESCSVELIQPRQEPPMVVRLRT